MSDITKRAVTDATIYENAGFDAVIVENFGDLPFFPASVPPETVASLAVAARAVRENVKIPCGVNCLRNDGMAALAIAAAAELQFIRINVLSGAAIADQGIVTSDACNVLRSRARLCPNVSILADVQVKHSVQIADRPIEEEAKDLIERAMADAVIVSGLRTGAAPDVALLQKVKLAIAHVPVFVGSGMTMENAKELFQFADGAIVGTSLKAGGITTNVVDAERAKRFVKLVKGSKWREVVK